MHSRGIGRPSMSATWLAGSAHDVNYKTPQKLRLRSFTLRPGNDRKGPGSVDRDAGNPLPSGPGLCRAKMNPGVISRKTN